MSILDIGADMALDRIGLKFTEEQIKGVPEPEQFERFSQPLPMAQGQTAIGTLPPSPMFTDVQLPNGQVVKAVVGENNELLYKGQVVGQYAPETGQAQVTQIPPTGTPQQTGPSNLQKVESFFRPGVTGGAMLWSPKYMQQGGQLTPEGQQFGQHVAEQAGGALQRGGGQMNPIEFAKMMWGIRGAFEPWGVAGKAYEEKVPLGARIATEVGIEAPMYIGGGKALGAIPRLARLPRAVRFLLGVEKARPSAEAMKRLGPAARALLGKTKPAPTKLAPAVKRLAEEAIDPKMPASRQSMLGKLKSVISTHRETRGALRGAVKAEEASRFGQLEKVKTAAGWAEVGAKKGALKGPKPRAVPLLDKGLQFTDDEAREMLKMLQERGATGLEITKMRDSLIKMGQVSADASEKTIRDVLQPNEWKLINRYLFPSKSAKGIRNAIEVLNMPRAFMASGDMSYTFRQLLFELPQQALRHPIRTTREVFNQFKVLVYKKGDDIARQLHDDILKDTQFLDDMHRMKVDITEATRKGTPWELREEAFGSYLANKVPWIRRSNNAAATIANRIRYWAVKDSADRLRGIINQGGKVNQADWDMMGRIINTGTGRGNISWVTKLGGERAAGLLNGILFSPRMLAAHFQFPVYSLKAMVKNPVLRAEVAKRWATTMGMGISTLAFLKQTGIAEVNLDPRSADFAKGKIGNTRFDLWGGKSQTLRFVVRLAMEEKKLQTGKVVEDTRWNTVMNFMKSKEAPGFAIIPELLGRPDYYDDENDWIENEIGREAYEHLTSLVLQDIVDALVKDGTIGDVIGSEAIGAGLVGATAFMGAGVQTYEGGETGGWKFGGNSESRQKFPESSWKFGGD